MDGKKVRIFWSGYIDFPDGFYTSGSKEGDKLSGEFPTDHIVLDRLGTSTFNIEPGEPTFPQSTSFSFTLKNKDSLGNQRYPESKMLSLGRTQEYGGKTKKFGDIFIKIDSPFLGRDIYFGTVKSFKYSKHNEEISIQCSDIVEFIKGNDIKMFQPFEFKNLNIDRALYRGNNNVLGVDRFKEFVQVVDAVDFFDNRQFNLIGEETSFIRKPEGLLLSEGSAVVNDSEDILRDSLGSDDIEPEDLEGNDLNLQLLTFTLDDTTLAEAFDATEDDTFARLFDNTLLMKDSDGNVIKNKYSRAFESEIPIISDNVDDTDPPEETSLKAWQFEEQHIISQIKNNLDISSIISFDNGYDNFIDFSENDVIWPDRLRGNKRLWPNFLKSRASQIGAAVAGISQRRKSAFAWSNYIFWTKWLNGFVQIGDYTLLTKYRIVFEVRLDFTGGTQVVTDPDFSIEDNIGITGRKVSLQVIHSNNKFTKIERNLAEERIDLTEEQEDSDSIFLFERTRFYKGTSNPKDDEIKSGDKLNVTLHEFDRFDNAPNIIFNGEYLNGKNKIDIKRRDLPILHSIFFSGINRGISNNIGSNSGAVKISPETDVYKHSFDLIKTLAKSYNDFVSREFSFFGDVNLFDLSRIGDQRGRMFFISDIMQYEWVDKKFEDALVNSARALSAFLFINERGEFSFVDRNLFNKFLPDKEIIPDRFSTSINFEDFSIDSGDSFEFEDDIYKIEFADILEANNLVSDRTVEKVVNSEGQVSDSARKPKDLEISNFRTSDLGIPNKRNILTKSNVNGPNNQRILRRSPRDLRKFARTPLKQAIGFAISTSPRNISLSISLDVAKNDDNELSIRDDSGVPIEIEAGDNWQLNRTDSYSDINVGRIVSLEYENIINYFMVRQAAYDVGQISQSPVNILKLELRFLGQFIGGNFLRVQSNEILTTPDGDKIIAE